MIDLSWFTIPGGALIFVGFFVFWFYLWIKQRNYRIILDKTLPPPLLSILVAAKDEEMIIANIVNDIKKQTYGRWELLILANNCDDDTAKNALKAKGRDNRVRVFNYHTSKIGKGPALNLGFDKSKGDVVLIIDADNRLKPDFLEGVAGYFQDESIDSIQVQISTENPADNILTRFQHMEFIMYSEIFNKGKSGANQSIFGGGTGFAIRRCVIADVGKWRNELAEDYEFSLRMIKNGYKITYAHDLQILDEKILFWDDLVRQRSRWARGNIDIMIKTLFDKTSWVDKVYSTMPIIALVNMIFLLLFYVHLFGGWKHITYFYYPIQIWVVGLILLFLMLFTTMIKRKEYINALLSPMYFAIYCFYYPIILFRALFVTSWAQTKTTHIGGKR